MLHKLCPEKHPNNFLDTNYRTGRTGRSQSLPSQGVGTPDGTSVMVVGTRVIDGTALLGMSVAVGIPVMVGYGLVVGGYNVGTNEERLGAGGAVCIGGQP